MTETTTLSIGIIVALVGCFIGLAGWLSGRDKRISETAEWRGEINAKLDVACGVKHDVDRIEESVRKQGERISAVESSAKQAHHRIDELVTKHIDH